MGIIAKAGEQTQRTIIPAGNYVARCYSMVHVGTSFNEMYDKDINKVRITWEFPTETHVFNEEKGPQPFVISKEYTLSMHEKSALRPTLESWRGKGFTEEEAKGFDITNLVGAYCMINVIHRKSEDGTKTYANIGSIASLPKGMNKPEGVNPNVIFDYDNNYDEAFINTLPDFIKLPLMSSNEYKLKQEQLNGAEHDKHMKSIAVEAEDDLPFILTIPLGLSMLYPLLEHFNSLPL